MAAYIDLNPLRAGLVTDPKDYRFCGYAEAVAGRGAAQLGIASVVSGQTWPEAQARYRELLFGSGAGAREDAASIEASLAQRVIQAGGKLPLAAVLRCRLRYFSDGAVLGTRAFVSIQLEAYRRKNPGRERSAPRSIPICTEWDDLATLRGLRTQTSAIHEA